jgi:hypothetical protein
VILGRNNRSSRGGVVQYGPDGSRADVSAPQIRVRPTPETRKQQNYIDIISNQNRMAQMADPRTIGPSFYAADQADQRIYLGAGFDGRDAYNADRGSRPVVQNGNAPAFATAARVQRHDDGTCDSVLLDSTDQGWVDHGGATPRDFKVVNW